MIRKIMLDETITTRKSMTGVDKRLFNQKEQVSMINQLYLDEPFKGTNIVLKTLKNKLRGYKLQDQKYKRYNCKTFITYPQLIEKLVVSKLKCHYCFKSLQVIYDKVREDIQWTLDRIDNNLEHTDENTVVSCLKCNIQRGRQCNKKYLFTKQMRIIKKY